MHRSNNYSTNVRTSSELILPSKDYFHSDLFGCWCMWPIRNSSHQMVYEITNPFDGIIKVYKKSH